MRSLREEMDKLLPYNKFGAKHQYCYIRIFYVTILYNLFLSYILALRILQFDIGANQKCFLKK